MTMRLGDWVAYRPAGISASYFWRIACNAGMLYSILPSVAISILLCRSAAHTTLASFFRCGKYNYI